MQGYENSALDILLMSYNEADLILSNVDKPEIWYTEDGGKYHRYFCDIWIPQDNLIIEVKSTFTYRLHFNNTNTKRIKYCSNPDQLCYHIAKRHI